MSTKFIKFYIYSYSLIFQTYKKPSRYKVQRISTQKDKLNMLIFSAAMKIFSLSMINASIFMYLQHTQEETLNPYTIDNPFPFSTALYFQVVTMCSIGYGEVTPKSTVSRITTTFFILISVIYYSSWLQEIINYLNSQKVYEKNQKDLSRTKNSLIIIMQDIYEEHLHGFLAHFYDHVNHKLKRHKYIK